MLRAIHERRAATDGARPAFSQRTAADAGRSHHPEGRPRRCEVAERDDDLRGAELDIIAGPDSLRGAIISGYSIENGTPFGKLPTMQAKLDASRAGVEVLHPGRSRELTKPIYVSWERMPYFLGAYANIRLESSKAAYTQLNQPDGRLLMAGDYLSQIDGWQEGGILSAHRAVALVSEQVRARAGGKT